MNRETDAQARAVLVVVDGLLDGIVEAVYLHGSAVMGGLKPHSDLDFLVVVARPTTHDERVELIERLASISNRERRPAKWRPIELTTITVTEAQAALDFQYGEWLRDEFAAGNVEPAARAHVDLPILLAMAREASLTLRGAAAREVLPQVDGDLLIAAMTHGIPDLLADIETDTANVLLTLARIWHTLETGRFAPKDEAAAAYVVRFGEREWPALDWARRVYLGREPEAGRDARREAEQIVAEIGRWLQSDANVDQISWR